MFINCQSSLFREELVLFYVLLLREIRRLNCKMKHFITLCALVALAALLCVGRTARATDNPFTYQIEAVKDEGRYKLIVPMISAGEWSCRYKLVTEDDMRWVTETGEAGKKIEKEVAQGRYVVEVAPKNIVGMAFGYSNAKYTDFKVTAWGDAKWLSLSWAFGECEKMTLADDAGKPDLSQCTSLERMFIGCKAMNSANLVGWDVSSVTDMNGMFRRTERFNQDLSGWDVSHVTYMNEMFSEALAFNQPLGAWNLAQGVEFELGPATSEENYQHSLKTWAAKSTTSTGVKLRVPNLFYGDAKEARTKLVSEKKWNISGDFEKKVDPKGNRPFVFIIKSWNEDNINVTIPLVGKDMKFSYQKMEAGAQPVTVEHQNGSYTFKASKNTNYLVKVEPKGVVTFQNLQMKLAYITSILQWGDVAWLTMEEAFMGAGALVNIAPVGQNEPTYGTTGDNPDLTHVKSCARMFCNTRKLKAIDFSGWDVSGVEDMTDIFFQGGEFAKSLADWKLRSCKSIGFEASSMSSELYSETLKGWAAQIPNVQSGVKVSARGMIYQKGDALAARQKLIEEKQWEFYGDNLPDYIKLSTRGDKRLVFFVGEEVRLSIRKSESIKSAEVKWGVDPNTVTLMDDGDGKKFTATAAGNVTVKVRVDATAEHDAVSDELALVILPKPTALEITCPGVTIDNSVQEPQISLETNTEYTFTAKVTPLTNLPDLYWRVTPEIGVIEKKNEDGTWTLRVLKDREYELKVEVANSGFSKTYKLKVTQKKSVSVEDAMLFLGGTEEQKTKQLTAKVEGLTSSAVTWSIDDAGKAFVELASDGKVTAKAVGEATITATSTEDTNIKGTCKVKVASLITGVTISKDGNPVTATIEAEEHKPFVLKATVAPETAPQEVTWQFNASEFSKEEVAEGVRFTPLKEGNGLTITAKSVLDNQATVTVNVKKQEQSTPAVPTTIKFPAADKSFELKKGESKTITLLFTPADNVNKEVNVTTDPAGAPLTVTAADGVLTITIKEGVSITEDKEIKVTVKSKVGTATDFCTIQLKKDDPGAPTPAVPTTIKFPAADKSFELKKGQSKTITLTFAPSENVNKEVWVTTAPEDAPLMATAADGVLTIKIKENASITEDKTVTVTVKSKVGTATDFCTVQLKKEGTITPPVVLEGITMTPATLKLKVKEEKQLTVTPRPEGATLPAVTWEVTKGKGIVTVDAQGKVKAVKEGTAEVTATAGGKTAICTVTVEKATAVENATLANLIVAPNPFGAQLRIWNAEAAGVSYEVVNALGSVVRSGLLEGNGTTIDTETLPTGVYFVRFYDSNNVQRSVRVIKY